ASISSSMKPRTRSRTLVSIGSNQSPKSCWVASAVECNSSDFVLWILMVAWSPSALERRIVWVEHPGDYATSNFHQLRYGTQNRVTPVSLWILWWNAIRPLRPAFTRLQTFLWFVAAVAGFAVRTEQLGVTSIVCALNLNPRRYNALRDH